MVESESTAHRPACNAAKRASEHTCAHLIPQAYTHKHSLSKLLLVVPHHGAV